MVKQQARRAEGEAAGIGLAERNTRRSDSIEAFGSVDVYNLGKSRVTIRHANKRSSTRAFGRAGCRLPRVALLLIPRVQI